MTAKRGYLGSILTVAALGLSFPLERARLEMLHPGMDFVGLPPVAEMLWIGVFALIFLWGVWRVQSSPHPPDAILMAGLGLVVLMLPLVGIPAGLGPGMMAVLVLLLASRELLPKRGNAIQRGDRWN